MTLDDLNDLDAVAAREAFRLCCGSLRWAAAMAASRPFQSLDAIRRRGDGIWTSNITATSGKNGVSPLPRW